MVERVKSAAATESNSISGEIETFVTNLFDPAEDIDPSFTVSPPPPPILVNNNLNDNNNNTNLTALNGTTTPTDTDRRDLEYEQDLYFVLVVTTCSVTVLIAVSLAIYRLIETLLEGGNNNGNRRNNSSSSNNANSSRNQSECPNRSRNNGAAPPQRNATSSIEFLSGFFPFTRGGNSSSGNNPSDPATSPSLMPRPFRSRGPKDAPPPYDNPPPYHVAISMESMPNDDLWSLKTASNPNTLSLPRGDSRRNRHQSSQTLSNRTPGPPGQTGAADIERVPEDEGESGVEIETNNEDEDSEIQIENAVEEGEIETNSEDNHIFRAHVVQVIAV